MFIRTEYFKRSGRILRATAMLLLAPACIAPVTAATLDTIGVTLLRIVTTNLDGRGIRVAHPEASLSTNSPTFEVRPSAVGQPVSLFTYYSTNGMSTNFPNAIGAESSHANGVAGAFYGIPGGVATNVAHVDNYEADYFISTYIETPTPPDPNARIVNQSFTFGTLSVPSQQQIDSRYDDAAAAHGTLFVSGADNSGVVKASATSYNGLGVAAFGGASAIGPTPDNGRSKPDLTAPAIYTSLSTPLVAGAAALLLQAALRGDGGIDTNSATDLRTLKALLLNGAVKPAGWTHSNSRPLDTRYGSGVLNVFNSYMQLAGGRHTNIASSSVGTGDPHPPTGAPGAVSALSGWNLTSLSSSPASDQIHHYRFNVTNSPADAPFNATATLVWNRQRNQTNINDLDLFLYDCATSNLVAQSISGVDNVEHLFVPGLPPGRYDLQVWKAGGTSANGRVTAAETYALAWEFFVMPLAISSTGTNVVLSWPVYPAGFALQTTTQLAPAAWSTIAVSPAASNGLNHVQMSLDSSNRFFRLLRQP